MLELINIADLTNPETGKTWREENLVQVHQYPVGSLVEICHTIDEYSTREDQIRNGLRLHVVAQTRDCDGTPLYSLGIMGDNEGDLAILESDTWPLNVLEMFHGYGEEQLKLIQLPENENS
jgi:hypothetical protein